MGIDPSESADKIGAWAERNGFFWPLAPVSAAPVKDYRIAQQSAAVGIDPSGEIVLRKNGGLQNEAKWREWLDTLAGTSTASAPAAAVPAAPAPVEAAPAPPPAPATIAPAPTTAPAQPAPTVAVPAPTAAPPAPTAPRPAPTPTPRPQPTATPVPTATPNIPVGHNVGQRAPDFTVTTVDGSTYTLSEVTATGKAVLVYFFATW